MRARNIAGIGIGAITIIVVTSSTAISSGQSGALVRLQTSNPGTPQVGNVNISGRTSMSLLGVGAGANPSSIFPLVVNAPGGIGVNSTTSNSIVASNTADNFPVIVGTVPVGSSGTNAAIWGRNLPNNTQGFLGYVNNAVYGTASGAGTWAGNFDGTFRVNGNIAIQRNDTNFPMSFSNTLGDKIALWGTSGDHYGFGIQGSLLQIHTDVVGSDIAFGYGTSAAMTETMRIKGNGNVGIGVAPTNRLQVNGRTHTTDFTMTNGGAANTVLLGTAGGVASWGTVGNARLTSDSASLSKVTGGVFTISGGAMTTDGGALNVLGAGVNKVTIFPNGTGGSGVVQTFGPNGANNIALGFLSGFPNNGYFAVFDSAGSLQGGIYVNAANQGIVFGDTKSFLVPDPDDVTKNIMYACIEGPEAAMYTRGTAQLIDGEAHIDLPDHFRKLAAAEGITVILTPRDRNSKGLGSDNESPRGFDVFELGGGKGNYSFHWEIKAVRKGKENWQPVREWDETLPGGDKAEQWKARLRSIELQKSANKVNP